MLLRLLASRLNVGQRRPDKFAIHNASLELKRKENTNPDQFSRAVRNSKSQIAAFPGEICTDPLD
jgi:hypothetical protein